MATTNQEAQETTARWATEHGAGMADFAGAYLSGSTIWRAADAKLDPASDIDVVVVLDREDVPPKLGKFRWDDVLLDASYQSAEELASPTAVLGDYHLAGCFRAEAPEPIADPSGRLAALREAVAPEFPRRAWVRRRCADARARVLDRLGTVSAYAERGAPGADQGGEGPPPFHEQVITWLFGTGVTTHVLLAAGMRNPTIRLRYPAARELLADYDLLEPAYDELLALLGCAHLDRVHVEAHLTALTEVFDATAGVLDGLAEPSPLFFASDLRPEARPIAIDGSRALIDRGEHREAVFWIVATFARCLTVLDRNGPRATFDRHAAPFADVLADLGLASPADLRARSRTTAAYLPRLAHLAEQVLAANPAATN
ncbi:hypothetical protein [Streptomyces sp. B6B3]|uniref:hypothetical protein n=1 Tax=Streptomyces sp. B6B3 TaxID=3153570 RepID=UPI00325D82FF